DLEERRARIEEPLDAVAHGELALLLLPLLRRLAAAGPRLGQALAEVLLQPLHVRRVLAEFGGIRVDVALDDGHGPEYATRRKTRRTARAGLESGARMRRFVTLL